MAEESKNPNPRAKDFEQRLQNQQMLQHCKFFIPWLFLF